MLADERLSAERLEQETLTQHNDIGGLRQGLDAMRQQLVSNEAAIADAQAREQVLLQELDSSRQAKRSVEATLLQAAEDNVQLEAALSEAEANAAASQSSAEDIRGLLVAAEVRSDTFPAPRMFPPTLGCAFWMCCRPRGTALHLRSRLCSVRSRRGRPACRCGTPA